ncbi:MAG: hypothetical protein EOP36_20345 [Rubrivivax sp.]|nr:MAG: hypothetical protein EOP36_20345 [Rubrivivax sp.]
MQRRTVIILILLAVAAALGLLLYASVRPSGMFRLAAPTPAPTTGKDIQAMARSVSDTLTAISTTTLLNKPRYTGQDALGRSWTLMADNAGQEGSATSATYILNQVQAEWTDPSQTTPFVISANQGRYQQTSSTLKLTGAVSASGIGFTLTAPQVDADLTTRKLQAQGGTRVTGDTGGPKGWDVDIAAPNLSADQNGNHLVLTGGVRAKFTPKGQ